MSKLEKILGLALTVMSSAYAYTVYKTVKHSKKMKQIDGEILEACREVQEVLDKHNG